jgi:parvulin-like peptidyl-prolyl isomerase
LPLRAGSLLLLALLAGCGRCAGAERAPQAPRPVAVVNGEPITAESLRRELELDRAGAGGDAEGPAREARRRALDDALDRRLLLQQARARGISVPEDQVERAMLALQADYPGTYFDDLLAQEKLSAAEVRLRLREQLTLERFFAQEVFPRLEVSDEELQRYYDEHPSEFDEPERVRARQVVVRTREEAARVRDELRRRPQSFAQVARRSSVAPEGKAGGDLGYFGKGSGMPEVFEICFRLPLLQISDVTPSPYGFHVFQVTERKPAGRRPFAEARAAIREALLRQKRSRAQEEAVAALRQQARITIDEKALDALAR